MDLLGDIKSIPPSLMMKIEKGEYQKLRGTDCCRSVLPDSIPDASSTESAQQAHTISTLIIEEDEEFGVKECCYWCRQRFCTKEKLRRRFPFTTWLPNYSLADMKGDTIAGITVAFTVVPQGLALALLAGLPPEYGLYTSFIGSFMYIIFGSCKDLAVGPTSILALVTAECTRIGGITYAVLLTFLSGIIQLFLGLLNLGFIVDFISFPVISGFTTAAALQIAVSQLKGLVGVSVESHGLFGTLYAVFANITHANIWDVLMGFCSLGVLIPLQMWKDIKFSESPRLSERTGAILDNIWWILTTGKNALVVLICAIVAVICLGSGHQPFTLTTISEVGLPPFKPPQFYWEAHDNATNTTLHKDFLDMVEDMRGTLVVVPLLSVLESLAVAKAFVTKKKFDATQEMIAIGFCNLMGSFVSAFPLTGSFSRSAVNHNSGVRTPLGGIITGSLVLLSLGLLSPYFAYIPLTSLCAIIIAAVIFMIRPQDIFVIWKTNKIDIIPYFCTLILCCFLGLEYGVIIGVLVSVANLLYQMARPKLFIMHQYTPSGYPYLLVRPDRSVFFPSVEYVKIKINKSLPENTDLLAESVVVIDGEHICRADSTMAVGMKNMIVTLKTFGILTIFTNMKKSVLKTLQGVNPPDFHHCRSPKQIEAVITAHHEAMDGDSNARRRRRSSETYLSSIEESILPSV